MGVFVGNLYKAGRTFVREARALINPALERKARALTDQVEQASVNIGEESGFARFAMNDLGCQQQLATLSAKAAAWSEDDSRRSSKKEFLINILRSPDVIEIPEILDIALHDEVIGSISRYFGQAPFLANLEVWLTPPNQTAVKSQLYHYDHRDVRQAKLFINLVDVDADAGPLHFLPSNVSLRVDQAIGYTQKKYQDEEVYSACSTADVLSTIGPAGSGFIVDTARCLHYGSRSNKRKRLVLMASFCRVNCLSKPAPCIVLDPVRQQLISDRFGDDPVRSFALNKG